MKLGTDDGIKVKWAIGLLSVAIAVTIGNFGFGQKHSAPIQSPPEQKKPATVGATKGALDPTFRAGLFEASRQLAYLNSSRNIFAMKEAELISPPDTGRDKVTNHDDQKPSFHEDQPLPIDLKFFGYFRKSGGPPEICVSQGGTVFLAHVGSLVGLRYKILEIKNTAILVQDVFDNRLQSIVLAQ